LLGHTSPISALAPSANGHLLASAQLGPTSLLRLWDVSSGQSLALIQHPFATVHALALDEGGARLAAVGKDARGRQALAVWDIERVRETVPVVTLLDAKVSSDSSPPSGLDHPPLGIGVRDARGRQALAVWDIERVRETIPVVTLLDAKVSDYIAIRFPAISAPPPLYLCWAGRRWRCGTCSVCFRQEPQ
jgi:WD40 repeat protein